ncbi:hypothetical protein SARC_03661 [Sphaeroforma arctica JP610]|uniref:Uncharacterized protein n=1 Tax=Sphaeroforma arctica JP610 TaxID=667725 RepID=A0A0L0G509_9EUKA|nr:hypothetical protein SARC_03661 [Sphaeroforma arctica JP610]KNC84117.1 hypothetical protein SARC_03661 [Sphaeroforma arctica JP610]|eukprot:XP_014158019.1 hypothetical protein SARC_03661 [Sphaeroforma arctica JP610]
MPNMCADCATICTPSKVTYPHPLDDRARKSSRHWRSINYIPGNKYRRAILVGVGLVVLWYLHSCKLIPPHIASDGGVHSKIAFGTERDVSAGSNLLVDRKTINDSDAILERIDIDTDTEIATANRYNTEHVGMDRDHISGGGTSSEDMKLDDGDAAVEKQKNRKNTQSIDIVADKDDIVIDANRPSLINTSQTTYMQSDNIGGAGKSTFSGRVAADISDGQQRVNTLKSFSSRLSQQGSLEGSDVSLKSIQIQTPEVSLQKTNKQQGFQDEFVREPTDEFVPRANDERLSYVLNSAAGVQGLTADTGLSFIPEYSPESMFYRMTGDQV